MENKDEYKEENKQNEVIEESTVNKENETIKTAAGDNEIGETAENVGIQNMLTGEFLKLEKTLVKDEQIEIKASHGRTTVTSSKDGDCRGALALESNLYRIHTGDNAWKPTADSGLENVEMSVTFSEESAGVTVI